MGRALGVVAQAVLAELGNTPQPACDLVAKLKVPERRMKDVLYRLVAGGHVVVLEEQVRRAHARTPLSVYGLPGATAPAPGPVLDLASLWRPSATLEST